MHVWLVSFVFGAGAGPRGRVRLEAGAWRRVSPRLTFDVILRLGGGWLPGHRRRPQRHHLRHPWRAVHRVSSQIPLQMPMVLFDVTLSYVS